MIKVAIFNAGHPRYTWIRIHSSWQWQRTFYPYNTMRVQESRALFGSELRYICVSGHFASYSPWNPVESTWISTVVKYKNYHKPNPFQFLFTVSSVLKDSSAINAKFVVCKQTWFNCRNRVKWIIGLLIAIIYFYNLYECNSRLLSSVISSAISNDMFF